MKRPLLILVIIMTSVLISAQVIHVPGDYGTIQEGINAASNGDTVLVDEGTWYENIRFKGKAIMVASHYILTGDSNDIHNTIIDGGSATNPDSASCVMFINNEDTTSVIAGFTITNGSGVMYASLQAQHGGGISAYNAGGKIIHNIISGNVVSKDNLALGGGISFITSSGQNWLVVRDNTINNNHVGVVDEVALGGGIYSSINTIICNNIIENNTCISENGEGNGAGIGCHSLFTQEGILILQNNIISHNFADGEVVHGVGVFIIYYTSTITQNELSYNYCTVNKYWGVGALIAEPDGKTYVLNNTFRENTGVIPASPGAGGGITIRESNDIPVIVDGNLFLDNIAKHGGGFYSRRPHNVHISNNVFMGDSAEIGGAIGLYMPEGDKASQVVKVPVIVNNTFHGNKAQKTGGAIRITGVDGDGLATFNNIFLENSAADGGNDIFNNSSDYYVWVDYSNVDENNITGLWNGDNNFPGNPDLKDDSCHLNEGSNCIDAGTASIMLGGETYYCPDHDIDGQWRPMNGTADIGVDEYAFVGLHEESATNNTYDLHVSPNPSSGAVNIQYTTYSIQYTKVEIYSAEGIKVKTLFSRIQQAGDHEFGIDLRELPNGIYFIRMQAGETVETTKVILIR